MEINKPKKEKTKDKIIHCFWELFRQKSIDKITVSEITTLTQINRSTFYAHFADVYDVLEQIEENYLPSASKIAAQCCNLQDKELMYQTFLKMFDNNYENLCFLLSDRGDPNFIVKLKNRMRPMLKENIPQIYLNNKYFDLTIEFFLSASINVITYWANHPSEITSEELFNHLHALFVHGIPYTFGIDTEAQSPHRK